MTEKGDAAKEEKLWQACRQLTPPSLLASADTWWLPQADSVEERERAASRVEVVMRWANETVPTQLREMRKLLDKSDLADADIDLRASIAVAAGIHISARRKSDGSQETRAGREIWCNDVNEDLALSLLKHRQVSRRSDDASETVVSLDSALVLHLLVHYLKPLFMAASPSNSINHTTGRMAPSNPNLSGASAARPGGPLMDNEVVWKGGNHDQASRVTVLGEKVFFEFGQSGDVLQHRHRALGCFNILHICCQSIRGQKGDGKLFWEEVWPLVLPPILALLEDSSPLYRLVGARIIGTTLLRDPLQGVLLLRTGVDSLMRARLESNLTFISSRHSAALLQSSSEALILLSQATSAGFHSGLTPSIVNVPTDGGKARHVHLSRLMDEGVLRVWAYAQSAISADDEEGINTDKKSDEGLHEEYEASDTINASIDILLRLTESGALGIAVARYLDVTLNFLAVQLNGLEARLDRRKSASMKKGNVISLKREMCAAKAIAALLRVCHVAPGLQTWSAICLSAVARVWAMLQDQKDQSQVQLLFEHLFDILHALKSAQPALMKGLLARLVELDRATFSPFLEL